MKLIDGNYESGYVVLEYATRNQAFHRNEKMWFEEEVPYKVQDVLNLALERGFRIRLTYGDAQTGKAWLEEYDVMGCIGHSMGPLKVPLLILRKGSSGGGALLTKCIVRIQAVSGRELYAHPTLHYPEMEIVKRDEPFPLSRWGNALTHEVRADGEVKAAFESEAAARKWIEFMRGERHRSW